MGLSIMATQASAVTFISTTGQSYVDGMRFVQFYFGLPIAMVILCATVVPRFHRAKVYTAYEFLEQRFNEFKEKFGDEVPLPDFWGGFRLTPERFEFWQGRQNRLHDRIVYSLENESWRTVRLSP